MPITAKPLQAGAPSGTRVLVVEDAGRGVTLTATRSEPWETSARQWLVSLHGRAGGYALERCFDASETMALVAALTEGTD